MCPGWCRVERFMVSRQWVSISGAFNSTKNFDHLANEKTGLKAPSLREFERTRFAISSSVTRIHEERGLGGEEQNVFHLFRFF